MEFPCARNALLRRSWPTAEEKDMLRKVSLRVSSHDNMYVTGEAEHYLSAGLSAVRCITNVLDRLGIERSSIHSVLDLPCGGGRVLRFLRTVFPCGMFAACDTDVILLKFSGDVHAARMFHSHPDFTQVRIGSKFDLIWCGSLCTHINERRCIDLLRLFYDHLSPNGVCIFSTQGGTAISWLSNRAFGFGLSESARRLLGSQVVEPGFGYAYVDYEGQEYGISIIEYDKLIKMAGAVGEWSLAAYLESGWDDFQDVYAFTKRAVTTPHIVQKEPFLQPSKWWEK
jgi:SAM-dependent methyltransferase